MKIKISSLALFSLLLISCGSDDSSSSQSSFYCNVEKQGNTVRQDFLIPGEFEGSFEVSVKNGVATVVSKKAFFNVSKTAMNAICESVAEELEEEKNTTYECGNGSFVVIQKISAKELGSSGEVFDGLQRKCRDLEEEWSEPSRTSSSMKEEKSSSSFEKISSSSLANSSSSSVKSSSSSEESSSSVKEISRVIHDEDFDGWSAASDLTVDYSAVMSAAFPSNKVLCLYEDSSFKTGINLDFDMPEGVLEFFFRPHEDFFDEPRVLVGNDGARLLVYFDQKNIVLMMNKNDVYRYIKEEAEILNGWNFVRVVWGENKASLFLNNGKVGEMDLEGGYAASPRSGEQELIVGAKSACCMSGAGMSSSMGTSADFGAINVYIPPKEDSEEPEEDDSEEDDGETVVEEQNLSEETDD